MKESCVTAAGTDIGSNNSPSFNDVSTVAMPAEMKYPIGTNAIPASPHIRTRRRPWVSTRHPTKGLDRMGAMLNNAVARPMATISPPREEIKKGNVDNSA